MPSRKSGSSESHPDSVARSSLRRLSSIASFQALFTRRRSNVANNSTDLTASSSSNLSVSSTIIPEGQEPYQVAASGKPLYNATSKSDPLPPLSGHSNFPPSDDSYHCLPDDPIGGMPRSRTFTDLPLPGRTKKTAKVTSSKSHSRLPLARRPSPANNARDHFRLLSSESKLPVPTRMRSSDREPLLQARVEKRSNHGRSTAFKENISLSPIKPIPALNLPSDSHDYRHVRTPDQTRFEKTSDNIDKGESWPSQYFTSSPPVANLSQHPAVQIARQNKKTPTRDASKLRCHTQSTTPKPSSVPRWLSQPTLKNVTNFRRQSQHGEIKQTQLMSARQAPTPPLPKIPLRKDSLARSTRVGGPDTPSSQHPSIREPGPPTPTHRRAASPYPSELRVTEYQHPSYWSGRLCALVDRFRNEELSAHILATSRGRLPARPSGDNMHASQACAARLKRAFAELHQLCVTRDAAESLSMFQDVYADTLATPELKAISSGREFGVLRNGSVGNRKAAVGASTKGSSVELGAVVKVKRSEARRASFVERLLGRPPKRRSMIV